MKNFFLSLKTAVWTLLGLIFLFFIGAYMMPAYPQVFGPMNSLLLFDWIGRIGVQRLWTTWWFFLVLAALTLLTVNTIVCSIQAIRGRWTRRDFLIRISPQVVHIGFLFILLAHLLGAGWGFRLSGMLPEQVYAQIPGNRTLYIEKINAKTDTAGYLEDWSATVLIYEQDQQVKQGVLGPNKPLFYRGAGIYLKSISLRAKPVAFLLVNRDPGAFWALVGGMLFTVGCAMLLVLKWKKG